MRHYTRLVGQDLPEMQLSQAREAVAKALTHADEEVGNYAAEGLGACTSPELRSFSEGCIAAIAARARLVSERLTEEREKAYDDRLHTTEILREVAPTVRRTIIEQKTEFLTELNGLAIDNWTGKQAVGLILRIFGNQTDSQFAIEFHRRVAQWMVNHWDAERTDRKQRYRRDYSFEHDCVQRIAQFVLQLPADQAHDLCQPFLAAVGNHPQEIAKFLGNLTIEEDRCTTGTSFWDLWQTFADEITVAPWVSRLEKSNGYGRELIKAIFLNECWQQDVRHWRKLEGHGHRIDTLAMRIPRSAAVLRAYCQFLHDIGEMTLPRAFVTVSKYLTVGKSLERLSDQETVFLLESLLRRYVYSEPHRLKADATLRSAVLALLDNLVDAGSSAAYRMRDDFVTPLQSAAGV